MSNAVSDSVLIRALATIKILEETIALHDPYNSIEDQGPPSFTDCEFPDYIEDPFELIRVMLHLTEHCRGKC